MTGIVLLTGATGFVGRQVLRALHERGVPVRVVVREGGASRLVESAPLESIVTTPDLFAEPMSWWTAVLDGVDTIVHAAWYAEPGKYLQSERNLDCLAGTLLMARAAAQAKVRRVIGLGTCFEYDLTEGRLPVDTCLRPLTPYAAAKVAAFQVLSTWCAAQAIEFAWCRLFYLYGEGEDVRRFVPYIRAQLAEGHVAELTNGTQVRDFLDVREAGRLVTRVALSSTQGPINICSGVGITVRELAERIADDYGRRDLLNFGGRPENLVDPPYVVGVV